MSTDAPDTGNTEEAPAATTDETGTATTTSDTDVDWKAEAEKFKALHKKQEERAKANSAAAKELEEFKKAAMSDSEKAVAEAKAQARSEALAEVGSRLVDAEVKVAAAGRSIDVDALLDGLNRSRFITDDGQPDTEAIAEWVERIAPAGTGTPKPPVDMGQGTRPGNAAGQIKDRAALKNMTPRQIEQARREGRLTQMLGGS